jgi:hypothetical protein
MQVQILYERVPSLIKMMVPLLMVSFVYRLLALLRRLTYRFISHHHTTITLVKNYTREAASSLLAKKNSPKVLTFF